MAEIRQKLLGWKTRMQLVKEGYAKTSLYYVTRKTGMFKQILPHFPLAMRKMESLPHECE